VVRGEEIDRFEIELGAHAGERYTGYVRVGDELSPLPIGSVQVLLPTYRLRFFRPASTSIRLVYGNDQIGQPNYDLALLAARVLGAAATPGVVDAESARPSSRGDRLVSPWAFWALIVVAVAVLLCVLLMLIRPSPGRESEI